MIFEVFPTFCLTVWEHSHFVSENYQNKCLCTLHKRPIKCDYVLCFEELRSFAKATLRSARLRWFQTCGVLKTLAMSLFIVTRFYNKSSLSTNNNAHFIHILTWAENKPMTKFYIQNSFNMKCGSRLNINSIVLQKVLAQ